MFFKKDTPQPVENVVEVPIEVQVEHLHNTKRVLEGEIQAWKSELADEISRLKAETVRLKMEAARAEADLRDSLAQVKAEIQKAEADALARFQVQQNEQHAKNQRASEIGFQGTRDRADLLQDHLDDVEKHIHTLVSRIETIRAEVIDNINQAHEKLNNAQHAVQTEVRGKLNQDAQKIAEDAVQNFREMFSHEGVVRDVVRQLTDGSRILVTRPAHQHEIKEGIALPVRQATLEEVRQGKPHGA